MTDKIRNVANMNAGLVWNGGVDLCSCSRHVTNTQCIHLFCVPDFGCHLGCIADMELDLKAVNSLNRDLQ